MDDLSALIARAQKGDKDAFGQIYNLFYRRIFRYCQFNTGKEEITQDICQDTFLRAWKSLPKFRQKGGSFQAYLFKIARNLIIDWSRKKKPLPLTNYPEIESEVSLTESIESQDETKTLKLAIDKLNEKDRQIIILRYFEELTTAEVARVVGLKEGALRVRIHRVLSKLKDLIQN